MSNFTGISRLNDINSWTVLKFLFRWGGTLLWYSLIVAGYLTLLALNIVCGMLAAIGYMSWQSDRAMRAHHRNTFHRGHR